MNKIDQICWKIKEAVWILPVSNMANFNSTNFVEQICMNSSGQDLARQIHTDLQSVNCLKTKFVDIILCSVRKP